MAAKKATPAAKKGVQPGKAASTRTGSKAAAKSTAQGASRLTKAAKATTAPKDPARPPKKATAKPAAEVPAKAPAKKAARARATAKATAKTTTTAKTPARAKAPAQADSRTASKAAPKPLSGAGAQPQRLRVTQDEKPWTTKEFAGIRAELEGDVARLQDEIANAEVDLAGLMRDVGDGAGDDPADAGTATFEREQEMSLANNAREVFEQSRRALARLAQGTYGICESCGNPIGKNRLLAFPRATLCMTCKSKQERR
jgi:RNA polymerase-binding protein DksA